jgi:hypothetical protein
MEMKFEIRIHPEQRQTRIPKILTKNFGNMWILVPNTKAAIVYSKKTGLDEVLKSLEILRQDLQLQLDSKRKSSPEEKMAEIK